ncbi:MAG: 6-phospho-beta-glucosidase [Armatimonadota bacterium]
MTPLKITVIGGGSTYTPELVEGFLHGDVPVREIALMDNDAARLAVVGGLARRMVAAAGDPLVLTLTTDRAAALDGADVVITQLRVGGMAARALDESIPPRYGLIGQETTGPGGFAKALRTVPVILDIDREMAARCPEAWLINFTNPSGLITEALRMHGRGKYVGLCNYPLTLKMNAAKALKVEETRLSLAYFGLNHLSWTRVLVDDVDRTADLIEIMIEDPEFRELSGYAFDADRLRSLELIPSGYLRYYYDTEKMVQAQREAPKSRAEIVREVEERLLAGYADPRVTTKPPELQQRGGAWYSTAAVRLVRDLWGEGETTHILNVRNDQAMVLLPPELIIETPARVSRNHIASVPTVTMEHGSPTIAGCPIPVEIAELIWRVKEYELYAVSAAITGKREHAVAALEAHPLLDGHHEAIPALLDALLDAHRRYLPQFTS